MGAKKKKNEKKLAPGFIKGCLYIELRTMFIP